MGPLLIYWLFYFYLLYYLFYRAPFKTSEILKLYFDFDIALLDPTD